ncbi:hypothetical protein ACVILK_005424 [Bradyrhizobium embrapense]
MTRVVFVIAPQVGPYSTDAASRTVKRVRSIFSAIEARGHTAAMLASEKRWPVLAQSAELARLLEQEAPGYVRRVETATERDAYFVLWPKDGFCDWGAFVAVADAPWLAAFAATFGKPLCFDAALSEGGMFVRTGDRALISSALPNCIALPPDLRVIRLPHPYSSDRYRRHQPEHHPLTHLDLDVALVPCAKTPLLLVSERYRNSYWEFIAEAADYLGLEVVEISQEEANKRGLNLVVLSERAVLLPAGCPQLSGLLADRLGSESIIEIQIDDVFNYNGGRGGLGCMSNVVREGTPST